MSANATPAVYKIAAIAQFPTGTQVPAFEGRILSVKAFHAGKGNGPSGPFDYSFQDLEIEDESGKLVVCLNNRPELGESWKGAYVAFIGGTGKHTGIVSEDHTPKKNDRNPNPKTIRRIRVTGAATMEDCEEEGQTQQRPAQRTAYDAAQEAQGHQPAQQRPAQRGPAQQQPPPQQTRQNQPQQQPAPRQQAATQQHPQQQRQQPAQQNGGQQRQNGGQQTQQKTGSTKEARVILAKISTLYGLCYDAAVAKAWDIYERHGYAVMPGTVGIMADKLLMESIRRVHVEDLPTSNPAELKGRPLCELLPFLEEALDHNLARRTQVEAAAKETARSGAPAAEQPRQQVQPSQQPAPAQQTSQTRGQRQQQPPADDLTRSYSREEIEAARRTSEDGAQWADDGDGSAEDDPEWKKGMEEDNIPF